MSDLLGEIFLADRNRFSLERRGCLKNSEKSLVLAPFSYGPVRLQWCVCGDLG